jgi:glycosyl transferase family 25
MTNPRTGTFVLNLDRSTDRMEWMTAQLDAFGMPYQRVAGIDGARDDLDAAMRSLGVRLGKTNGRSLAKAEIACYLSHLAAIKRALAQNCAAALILEDDAQVLADIPPVLDDFARYQDKPYILRLEPWHKAHWQVPVGRFADVDAFYTPDSSFYYCTAYCLTRAAMQTVTQRLTEISAPFDIDIYSRRRSGLSVLISSPPLAAPSNGRFESLIQTERKASKAPGQSRLKRLKQRVRKRHDTSIAFTRIFNAAFQTTSRFGLRSILKLRLRPKQRLSPADVSAVERVSRE